MKKIEHRHLNDFLELMAEIIKHWYFITPEELEKEIDEYSDRMSAWCCFPSAEYIVWNCNKII